MQPKRTISGEFRVDLAMAVQRADRQGLLSVDRVRILLEEAASDSGTAAPIPTVDDKEWVVVYSALIEWVTAAMARGSEDPLLHHAHALLERMTDVAAKSLSEANTGIRRKPVPLP